MKREQLTHAVRKQLRRLPLPYEAHYGVVPLPPPEHSVPMPAVAMRLSAADAALTKINTIATSLRDPFFISRILPRQEAVSSSAIEGTNSTLDELLWVEETGTGEAKDAAVQVRDYALALDEIIPRARLEKHSIFTVDLVKQLHKKVMAGDSDYDDVPGEFRSSVVWIGGTHIAHSTYNPTPPKDIAAVLEDTMSYMRCEGMQAQNQSLVVRMAIAHSHFEAVHPFRDGNGRVGRQLLPIMMAAEGHTPLYVSPYIETHKNEYYAALKAAQQKLDWQAAADFLADAIVGSADELLATRSALIELIEIWRQRRKFRRGSAALGALDQLAHYPVLTINRLADLLAVSFTAASQAVEQLVEAGILVERTGYERNRIFAAPEALTIVNRPFGETPMLPR